MGRTTAPGRWEPEPLRWIGVNGALRLTAGADRAESHGQAITLAYQGARPADRRLSPARVDPARAALGGTATGH